MEHTSGIQTIPDQSESSVTFPCFLSDKREELTEILRSRLIECGWRDQVANMCRNLIQEHGVEQIRLEQIIGDVRQKARQSVPEQVKTEILEMIRKLDQNQLQPTQGTQHKELPQTILEQEAEGESISSVYEERDKLNSL